MNESLTAEVSEDGWLSGVRRVKSPNFDLRPPEDSVCLVVIHAISLPPSEFGSDDIVDFFTNRLDSAKHPFYREIADVRVSAHFLIRRDGELIQFVGCNDRAWHAGASAWRERIRCNDFSIGIELEGCDERPFESAQYVALVTLLRCLCAAYPIDAIVGHCDIAPRRKTDPGPCFDWREISERFPLLSVRT